VPLLSRPAAPFFVLGAIALFEPWLAQALPSDVILPILFIMIFSIGAWFLRTDAAQSSETGWHFEVAQSERDENLLDSGYALLDHLQDLIWPVRVAEEKALRDAKVGDANAPLSKTAFVMARLKCQAEYGRQFRTRTVRIFQRFKNRGVVPEQTITWAMKQAGRFEDLLMIKGELSLMLQKLDRNDYLEKEDLQ
jgi:hypothetical protein